MCSPPFAGSANDNRLGNCALSLSPPQLTTQLPWLLRSTKHLVGDTLACLASAAVLLPRPALAKSGSTR